MNKGQLTDKRPLTTTSIHLYFILCVYPGNVGIQHFRDQAFGFLFRTIYQGPLKLEERFHLSVPTFDAITYFLGRDP